MQQYSNPELTKEALLSQGCMELKNFVKNYPVGSCFYSVREFQLHPIESGAVVKMFGFWRFENGNGYNLHFNGDDLVLPTDEAQPEQSIYCQYGLDKARHDAILMKTESPSLVRAEREVKKG